MYIERLLSNKIVFSKCRGHCWCWSHFSQNFSRKEIAPSLVVHLLKTSCNQLLLMS